MNLEEAVLMLLFASDCEPITSDEHLEWMLYLLSKTDPELQHELEISRMVYGVSSHCERIE